MFSLVTGSVHYCCLSCPCVSIRFWGCSLGHTLSCLMLWVFVRAHGFKHDRTCKRHMGCVCFCVPCALLLLDYWFICPAIPCYPPDFFLYSLLGVCPKLFLFVCLIVCCPARVPHCRSVMCFVFYSTTGLLFSSHVGSSLGTMVYL